MIFEGIVPGTSTDVEPADSDVEDDVELLLLCVGDELSVDVRSSLLSLSDDISITSLLIVLITVSDKIVSSDFVLPNNFPGSDLKDGNAIFVLDAILLLDMAEL